MADEYKPPISIERVRGHWIGILVGLVVTAWHAFWAIAGHGPVPVVARLLLAPVYGFLAYWFWRAIDDTGWRVMSRYLSRR